ncbi:MAG: phosphoglucosamine mutase [Gammaproteobacteria bacterium]|jgi:phosphoglucosamine mutase|nr:phosphoglucosamine mutase [Gammaproteobacteria bacterium]MBT3725577.1 phosphoglucosamine mutase [Gammaproteobacteria bacterium]MBT4197002.1 phosphoglucosamine mutase [Gammaproteobacteria bacterium]MBT4451857.1 phosphoglucosamine mutase [Gammaproteobacteria bacterium]MBT4860768.1 phosphoglucosamine mutase [Gammaproteobacteria bacterium]
MTKRYFGTDGIRGRVGQDPMTAEFVMKLGWAAGKVLSKQEKGHVVIGKDTRISGYIFEAALEAGLAAAGLDVTLMGPMPTPAVAYMTQAQRATAGIVISASHNPYYDDGVKFFSGDGFKLPDSIEHEIEDMMDQPMKMVESKLLGKVRRLEDSRGRYIEFCKNSIPFRTTLKGMKIVLDCANGATYHIAPHVFRELGAEVFEMGVSPNGLNINKDCGALHPQNMRSKVLEHQADLGIAFDGDGDRLMMMDATGEIMDGDEILFVIAKSQLVSGGLGGGVVGTLMTNLGLEHALKTQGIKFERANVGDRSVMERLKANGWFIGGESSGHIIALNQTTTGDGIIAALQVLSWMVEKDLTLAEAKMGMHKYPQVMVNVPVAHKLNPAEFPQIQQAVEEAEQELANKGRVLLRPSGTEPLIRVMVEGDDAKQVETLANQIADVVKKVAPKV